MTTQTNEKTIGQVLTVRYKSPEFLVLHYRGLQDLENLIKFVGKSPVINADMTLKYKKQVIKNDCYVFVNDYGDVTKVVSLSELKLGFDCSPLRNLEKEDHNIIKEREVKSKK